MIRQQETPQSKDVQGIVKFLGGLDATCQVLYNGLQDVHKIGVKTQCLQGAQRILMERND